MFERVFDEWMGRPLVDTLVPTVLVAAHLAAYHYGYADPLLACLKPESRPGLYGASALVVSLTGTFASLAVGQYLSNKGSRIRAVKEKYSKILGRTWRSIFLGTVAASALLLTAYALDSRMSPGTAGMWVFEYAIFLAAPRLVRLAILTSLLINVSVADETAPLADPSSDDVNKDLFTAP